MKQGRGQGAPPPHFSGADSLLPVGRGRPLGAFVLSRNTAALRPKVGHCSAPKFCPKADVCSRSLSIGREKSGTSLPVFSAMALPVGPLVTSMVALAPAANNASMTGTNGFAEDQRATGKSTSAIASRSRPEFAVDAAVATATRTIGPDRPLGEIGITIACGYTQTFAPTVCRVATEVTKKGAMNCWRSTAKPSGSSSLANLLLHWRLNCPRLSHPVRRTGLGCPSPCRGAVRWPSPLPSGGSPPVRRSFPVRPAPRAGLPAWSHPQDRTVKWSGGLQENDMLH